MLQVQDRQCGMCAHFGEHAAMDTSKLTQIRTKRQAPASLIEPCGHPKHESLHLKVTAVSTCDGFTPAN